MPDQKLDGSVRLLARKKDVLRCLKRFIAREAFGDLKVDLDLP